MKLLLPALTPSSGAPLASVAASAPAAICQSGFPEQSQNDVALRICRNFARAAGFDWAGEIPMGGGGMIDGRPVADLGGQVRRRARALALTADALCEGRDVPDEAVTAMGKLPTPAAVYRAGGNLGWRRQAKKAGVRSQVAARPFEEPRGETPAAERPPASLLRRATEHYRGMVIADGIGCSVCAGSRRKDHIVSSPTQYGQMGDQSLFPLPGPGDSGAGRVFSELALACAPAWLLPGRNV